MIKRTTLLPLIFSLAACSGGGGGGGGDSSALLPPSFGGCTDPLADNYDPTKIYDDGSCTYNLGPRVYKAYFFPADNPVPLACGGTQTLPQRMTYCMDETTWPAVPVDEIYCNAWPYPAPVTYQSPAGNRSTSIANGTKLEHCYLGESNPYNVTYNCNAGYYQSGGACVATPPPVDTTQPTVTIGSANPVSPNYFSSVLFSYYADEPSTFYCQIDGGTATVCGAGEYATKVVDQTGLVNVGKTFKVWAVDAAGNSGENVSGKYYSTSWTVWNVKTAGLYDFEALNGNDSTLIGNHILNTFFSMTHPGYNDGASMKVLPSYDAYISGTAESLKEIDMTKGLTVEAFIKENDKTLGVDMPLVSKAATFGGTAAFEFGIRYTSSSKIKLYYLISCASGSAPQRLESSEFDANLATNFQHIAVGQANNNVYFYYNADKVGAGNVSAGGCNNTNKYKPYFESDQKMYVGVSGSTLADMISGIDYIDRLRISRTDRTLGSDPAANLCRGASLCAVD